MSRDHDHDHDHGHDEPRPSSASWGHLFSNWDTYEASFGKKIALALRNATIGRAKYGTCCGHYGEPGC